VAAGRLDGRVLQLSSSACLADWPAFEAWLGRPGPWLAAFDFPFGLPRELVESLDWPREWLALMAHFGAIERKEFSRLFAAFRAARPPGGKWAHRATDIPAGASPSMRDVNPPVAFMLHAGVPRLIAAGVHVPALRDGDLRRVALEAYPGLLARELIGRRSYKSDERRKQTAERAHARRDLVAALEAGCPRLGLRLRLDDAQRSALVADPMADSLDAVLCLLQAAWASTRPNWGLPGDIDPLEGWIVSA
jgi:hypothetical protein